ncbi:MAG: tRNA (adenosine(37)-N6)-threonylcarbamoyltransferase complex dimerization subunit type 1 TsaB [Actinobacteria bacterium]|nr:tRNA (adenosine(37)-N6)-threonylcarbamoyltransferase complex dimerization subunit type 1 TsaB [Actinomycetota bacterium]
MIVLALETASRLVGVALGEIDGGKSSVWAEFKDLRGRRHVEALMPAVQFVLDETGMELADVDVIAVDIGPGLFAGLRVGISTAKALAMALGVPVVTVPSLDVLAGSLASELPVHLAGASPPLAGGSIVAVLDAKRGEVFWSCYRPREDSGIERVVDHRATPPEVLADWLVATEGGHILIGDGAQVYASHFDVAGAVVCRGDDHAWPTASALLHMAGVEGAYPLHDRPNTVEPIYLRHAEARINWEQRQHP